MHLRHVPALIFVFLIPILFAACAPEPNQKDVKRIKIQQGADQYAMPGKPFAKELRVIACGPEIRGVSGKVRVNGIPGIKLRMTPLEGSDLQG